MLIEQVRFISDATVRELIDYLEELDENLVTNIQKVMFEPAGMSEYYRWDNKKKENIKYESLTCERLYLVEDNYEE